jgi:beta-lactam-binding protein with PASTA domain
VQVPNVVGLGVEEARSRLTAAGLNLVSVNGQTRAQLQRENPAFLQANPNPRSGAVISQSLAPGTSVQRGTSINIAFFQGP